MTTKTTKTTNPEDKYYASEKSIFIFGVALLAFTWMVFIGFLVHKHFLG